MSKSLSLVLTVLFCLGLSAQVFGQEEDTEESLLPDIDPQDIEIRSQFQARFPGLSRQPILGFDPEPRVYQVDPDREPFMETDEEVVANLPVSELSRPDPPGEARMSYAEDANAFSRLGIGSYSTPRAQFWGAHRINSRSYIGADFDYSSSNGHLDNQPSSFRFMDAGLDFATQLGDEIQLQMDLDGKSNFNHLQQSEFLETDTPRKTNSAVNFGANVQRFKNSIEGWKALGEIDYFNANVDAAPFSDKREETLYRGSFTKRWAGDNINETYTIKAGARAGVFGTESTEDQNGWTIMRGGMAYQRLFNYNTELTADASVYFVTDPVEEKVYFAPEIDVLHSFTDKVQLETSLSAKPYVKGVARHHQQNRFLNTSNQYEHTHSLDASAEMLVEYYRESTIEAGASYMNARNYPYYQRNEVEQSGGDISGDPFYSLDYMDATKFKIFAGLTHQLVPHKFWLDMKVYAQNTELNNGNRIPYTENWGVNSGFSIQLLDPVKIEGWADYVGSRRGSLDNQKMDGFLLLGGQADVEVTDRIGIYAEVVNLLGSEYEIWDGYTERPQQFYGGITLKF